MNPLTFESQVLGGMAMGIGFALTERRVVDRQSGAVVSANWHDYKIPTAKDVPVDQRCLSIDLQDTDCNSVGAKGIGEPATMPTAAAIANAVYDAVGVRVLDSPISPMRLLRLLAEQRKKS
jgi:CO/xanthine dehydrogenase Mo-binding subunit